MFSITRRMAFICAYATYVICQTTTRTVRETLAGGFNTDHALAKENVIAKGRKDVACIIWSKRVAKVDRWEQDFGVGAIFRSPSC